ncbi:hypothetical protein [Streptomyces sp. NPDC126522]|uniref:hypothetical protein n=1 Tax=Streptomyces sp. NPDC126522 TaxID=3155211 RepID=UPI00331FE0A6
MGPADLVDFELRFGGCDLGGVGDCVTGTVAATVTSVGVDGAATVPAAPGRGASPGRSRKNSSGTSATSSAAEASISRREGAASSADPRLTARVALTGAERHVDHTRRLHTTVVQEPLVEM